VSRERDDDPIRERFAELRAETRASGRVPDVDAVLARARAEAAASPELRVLDDGTPRAAPTRSRRRFVLAGAWTSAALAAAVAGLILTGRGGSDDEDLEFERLVATYAMELGPAVRRSPTSSLMQVPGMELLRSVPSLGGPALGAGAPPSTSGGEPPREENR
jgi:hypothetical protein